MLSTMRVASLRECCIRMDTLHCGWSPGRNQMIASLEGRVVSWLLVSACEVCCCAFFGLSTDKTISYTGVSKHHPRRILYRNPGIHL